MSLPVLTGWYIPLLVIPLPFSFNVFGLFYKNLLINKGTKILH